MELGVVRGRFLSFVDVIMRVPPLFIIDELLRIGFGLPGEGISQSDADIDFRTNSVPNFSDYVSMQSKTLMLDPDRHLYHNYLIILLRVIACCFGNNLLYLRAL